MDRNVEFDCFIMMNWTKVIIVHPHLCVNRSIQKRAPPRSIKTDSFTVCFRTWSQDGTLTAVNRPYLSVISGTVLRHRIRRRISPLIRLLYGYLRI